MRFLSKKYIWVLLIVLASCMIVFLHNNINCDGNNLVEINLAKTIEDDTIFNLSYDNKTWTMHASEFELKSNIFSINSRINNLNKNQNKNNKINLIDKLINIKIEPQIAFNYVYYGFDKKLNKIIKNIEKNPQNAELNINNNKINIKNEIIGIKVDKYKLYEDLIKLYKIKSNINLAIPVVKTVPEITAQMLRLNTCKRAEFTTSISTSSAGRKHNVRRALTSINGTKLSKREKFSFNNVVGRRTTQNGYREAKVILDGEFVEGVGGGVCQVSSTLYNAALLAGLNILSSQKHSQRVGYVKAGFDAMVNYGTSDLVFENNTDGDIYILCKYNDDRITISIYGMDMGNITLVRESEMTDEVLPGDMQVIYDADGKYLDRVQYIDESFELKKAKNGYTIKSYLITLRDNVEVERKLLRTDKYLPQRKVLVFGCRPRESVLMFESNL